MKEHSFRFVDDRLNRQLIARLQKARVQHTVDDKGVIHYSPDDEGTVGNELISSIRDRRFPSWQIVDFPAEWTDSYKQYMTEHNIPFVEELMDGRLCFLISGRYRPHSWKLDEPCALQKRKAAV